MKEKDFKKKVCRLLEYGIEQYRTRYDSQSRLIYYYWILGYTREQNYEAIKKWYYSHNHQSRTWQAKPQMALDNALSAVNSLYRSKEAKNQRPYEWFQIQLRAPDALKIITFTPDYRLQKFIFSLLHYARNKIRSLNKFDLPWEAIIRFDCCSDRSYLEKLDFCKSIGLITKSEECSRALKQSRIYKVNFRFTEDGNSISILEDGLVLLFSPEELRKMYSKWYFKRIMARK